VGCEFFLEKFPQPFLYLQVTPRDDMKPKRWFSRNEERLRKTSGVATEPKMEVVPHEKNSLCALRFCASADLGSFRRRT
jgi:hypothetical protein